MSVFFPPYECSFFFCTTHCFALIDLGSHVANSQSRAGKHHVVFNRCVFLQETQQIPTEDVALDICLSNGQKVTVNILTSDQTEDVLDVSARARKHTAHGGAAQG